VNPRIPITGSRVLVVDDVPTNIDVLRMILEPEGVKISFATSGQQALEVVSRMPVDLILLDVTMPGFDGFETCQRLKADPATRDIAVIFVSARIETEDVVKGFELGAVDYVIKPFRSEEVRARVRTQLGLRILLRELARHRSTAPNSSVTCRR
jgi:PleD family two-component response regulator